MDHDNDTEPLPMDDVDDVDREFYCDSIGGE